MTRWEQNFQYCVIINPWAVQGQQIFQFWVYIITTINNIHHTGNQSNVPVSWVQSSCTDHTTQRRNQQLSICRCCLLARHQNRPWKVKINTVSIHKSGMLLLKICITSIYDNTTWTNPRKVTGATLYVAHSRVAKCDVIISQIFTFKPQNHIKQCTQQLREYVPNVKSLAVLKAKIEPIVPY